MIWPFIIHAIQRKNAFESAFDLPTAGTAIFIGRLFVIPFDGIKITKIVGIHWLNQITLYITQPLQQHDNSISDGVKIITYLNIIVTAHVDIYSKLLLPYIEFQVNGIHWFDFCCCCYCVGFFFSSYMHIYRQANIKQMLKYSVTISWW